MARKAKKKPGSSPAGGKRKKAKKHHKRYSAAVAPELRQEILREVASGRKAIDVAKEYGVHNTTISVWKRAAKSPPRIEVLNAKGREETPRAPAAKRPMGLTSMDQTSMDQTPPRETGRYRQSFKEEVLKQVFSGRKIAEVARQYEIPDRTIGRWLGNWGDAGGEVAQAKTTRPQSSGASPINEEHRALVLSLKANHVNMGLAQVQNQLKRFHALKLSRHMIGRIFKEAGIPLQKRSPGSAESDHAKNRFEMTRPGELWAVDFKEFWVHSEKAYGLFIIDDFSRFCVGHALTQKPSAELAINTAREAIGRYGRPERILSDRGPQFHAWNGISKFDEFLADFFIDHSVTKANHAFTNGKIESFNRSIEAELLDVEEFASLVEAEEHINSYVRAYNFFRTHMGIGGLVPADRFFGMVEEARVALVEGLKKAGPGLTWLKGLASQDGMALRQPTVLQLVLREKTLELVVLGRRFTLGR